MAQGFEATVGSTICAVLPVCWHLCVTCCHLEYELICRCANFMNTRLVSCNELVNFAARNGIFFERMASPMGRNAQWCCDTVRWWWLYNGINKDLVFRRVNSGSSLPDWVLTSVSIVHELLQVRCNRMCLQLLSS